MWEFLKQKPKHKIIQMATTAADGQHYKPSAVILGYATLAYTWVFCIVVSIVVLYKRHLPPIKARNAYFMVITMMAYLFLFSVNTLFVAVGT